MGGFRYNGFPPITDTVEYVTRHLTLEGVTGGTYNANVNGSVTPQLFWVGYDGDPDTHTLITRLIIEIRDTGNFRAETYGILAALTNGVKVGLWDVDPATGEPANPTGPPDHDFTDGVPIKQNAGWAKFCDEISLKAWSVGDEFLVGRWDFFHGGIHGIVVDESQNHVLGVQVNDDLTGLVEHEFVIQGYRTQDV